MTVAGKNASKMEVGGQERNQRTDFHQLWKDMVNYRLRFTWSQFITALILGLAFSALDTGSDIAFAEQDHESTWIQLDKFGVYLKDHDYISSLTYLYVSLPGLVLTYSFLQTTMETTFLRMTGCHDSAFSTVCLRVTNLLSLVLLAGGVLMVRTLVTSHTIKYVAIPTATAFLSIKVLALFVHSKEMKRLSVKATMAESSFESSLQLFSVIMSSLMTENYTKATVFSGFTSFLMLGKSGAESHLMFSKVNKLEDAPLLDKLWLIAQHAPVFALVAAFRIGSLSVIAVWDARVCFFLLCALTAPLLVLMVVKWFALSDLTLGDLARGVLGELSIPSLWGGRSSEGCRRIQLAFACFYLAMYSGFMVWVIVQPTGSKAPFCSTNPADYKCSIRQATLPTSATICLFLGWTSLLLFLGQIYLKPTISRMSHLISAI